MGQQETKADDLETIVEEKQNLIKQAAEKIAEADFLLLATGAGWSADSGLAVYKDIADVPAYHEMKLDYMDLCQPHWLEKDPEIFYGFWGMCFNDYRRTTPHEGYTIVKKWKEAILKEDSNNTSLEKALENLSLDDNEKVKKFFVYTSNVDSHSQKSGFSPDEVHEIHGSTEVWQCSLGCTAKCWEAPDDFKFEIDTATMRCKKGEKIPNSKTGWETNHPTCPHCGALARPSILMFADDAWIDGRYEQKRAYGRFKTIVFRLLKQNPKLKVVVIEAGCGLRVPTVRWQTDSWLEECPTGQCTVVRINPDYPGGKKEGLIRIVGHSKEVLQQMDQHVEKIKAEKQKPKL